MTMRHARLVLAAGLLIVPAIDAQRPRTLEVSRQLRDSAEHSVRVRYAAGRFRVAPTSSNTLFAMELQYDENRGEPVHTYDAQSRKLVLGLNRGRNRFAGLGRDEESELRLGLSTRVPMDLTIDLGAAAGIADLTGMRLTNLSLNGGAADLEVRMDSPNPEAMRSLDLDVGAATMRVHGIANANTGDVSVDLAAGDLTLIFDGTWTRDIDARIDVALGHILLRVPAHVGVSIDIDRVLASFERSGMERRGGAYVSRNFDEATHRLRVKAEVVLGGMDLEHR